MINKTYEIYFLLLNSKYDVKYIIMNKKITTTIVDISYIATYTYIHTYIHAYIHGFDIFQLFSILKNTYTNLTFFITNFCLLIF